MRIDETSVPAAVNVADPVWFWVELSSSSLFEASLDVLSSHPGLVPISANRRIWLPANGVPIRVCIELIALEASDAPVEIQIKLTAASLQQLGLVTVRVEP